MKKKRLLSLILVSALSVSMLVGCGKSEEGKSDKGTKNTATISKVDVKEEKAFETIPENNLIPNYIKKHYSTYEESIEDYKTYLKLFLFNEEPENAQEFLDKYGISRDIESITDVSKINPDFYEGAITYAISTTYESSKRMNYIHDMKDQVHKYIGASLAGDKTDVKLAKEFEELEPIKYVQKYLKKNNIEITNITYPTTMKTLDLGPTTIIELPFTIEGTQDGKSFSETKNYNFYFVSSEDIRNGADARYEDNIELMAVTDSVFDDMKFNLEKVQSLYE